MNLPGKKKSLFPFVFKKRTDEIPSNKLPKIRTKTVPGPNSLKLSELMRRYECPQVTYVGEPYPIFLKSAKGANVTDADGNRYLDLSSSFAVAGIGHGNEAVLEAVKNQSREMMHGMGDVHPNEVKILLAKKLSEITPGHSGMVFFSSTGAEAVETALKTAVMHTKKTGVIAFTGSYHGLSYGTLPVTHREDFKKPFQKQLGKHVYFAPFPDPKLQGSKASELSLKAVVAIIKKVKRSPNPVGAVLIEPIQGRGGVIVPPPNFLKELRAHCEQQGILLIADEIFTGFGRTGSLFAVDKSQVVPDLICLGKGMGNGFPISACVGPARIMRSWGVSTGESLHTSTFLGNPLGCAVALAVIKEIEDKKLVDRSRTLGEHFRRELHKLKERYAFIADVRGAGLMIGLEFGEYRTARKGHRLEPAADKARFFTAECLKNGLLVLSSGPFHNVVTLTPPFVISEKEITHCVSIFDKILKRMP